MDAGVAVVGSVLNEVPLKSAKKSQVSSVCRRRADAAGTAAPAKPPLAAGVLRRLRGRCTCRSTWWAATRHLADRRAGPWRPDPRWSCSGCSGVRASRSLRAPPSPAPAWGWPLFAFGLFVYFVGRVVRHLDPRVRLAALRRRRRAAAAQGPRRRSRRLVPALLLHLHDAAARDLRRRDHRPLKQWISIDRRRAALRRRLSDLAHRRDPHHRPVPDAGRRRLLGPALDVQPVGARHAVHVHHGRRRAGCTTRSCWRASCRSRSPPTSCA